MNMLIIDALYDSAVTFISDNLSEPELFAIKDGQIIKLVYRIEVKIRVEDPNHPKIKIFYRSHKVPRFRNELMEPVRWSPFEQYRDCLTDKLYRISRHQALKHYLSLFSADSEPTQLAELLQIIEEPHD